MKLLNINMLHRHHIIPKHMGGTDDPANIKRLTRKKHAEAHRLLYEEYGKREDLWAWKFLSRSKDWIWLKTNNPMKRPEVRAKVSCTLKEYHKLHPESSKTRELKRLVKLGNKNPSFGKHGFGMLPIKNHHVRIVVSTPHKVISNAGI